jgi:hypothetical protein
MAVLPNHVELTLDGSNAALSFNICGSHPYLCTAHYATQDALQIGILYKLPLKQPIQLLDLDLEDGRTAQQILNTKKSQQKMMCTPSINQQCRLHTAFSTLSILTPSSCVMWYSEKWAGASIWVPEAG